MVYVGMLKFFVLVFFVFVFVFSTDVLCAGLCRLEYWLKKIKMLGGFISCPVILVGTHLDHPNCNIIQLQNAKNKIGKFKMMYPNIKVVYCSFYILFNFVLFFFEACFFFLHPIRDLPMLSIGIYLSRIYQLLSIGFTLMYIYWCIYCTFHKYYIVFCSQKLRSCDSFIIFFCLFRIL